MSNTPSTPTPSRRQTYDSSPHLTSPHSPVHALPTTIRQRRTRCAASMVAGRASSSSDSASSQADHDTEPEPVQPDDDHSAPHTAVPPKKKRTRTLTTPHQSAVLHALLAKSRFPTTAMREDVGRQIGLSARKVQIWFQNQRQKARRPQGDSAPLTRPPQFGPFPIITPPGPSPSSSYPPLSAGSASEQSLSGPSSARSAMNDSGGSLDSNPALSGPGMPGQPSSSHPSADERDPPSRGIPTSPSIPLAHSQLPLPPRLSEGSSKLGGTRAPFMASLPPPGPSPTSPVDSSPHFSRVLPPIYLAALRTRTEPHLSVSAASPSFPPPPPPPPSLSSGANAPPRTSVTIVQRHDASRSGTPSPGALCIPPPFALQPKPQWDPQTFAPYTRPEFASWSQTGRSSRRTGYHGSPDRSRTRHGYEPREHPMNSPPRGHRHPSTTCRATDDAGGA